jgi:hypothetical protein
MSIKTTVLTVKDLHRRNAAAIGLINLIYNLARYEQIVRLKLLPRNAAWKTKFETKNDRKPTKREQLIVKTNTKKGVTMKPATPKTELSPLIQPRKVVFGGSLNSIRHVLATDAGRVGMSDEELAAILADTVVMVWSSYERTDAEDQNKVAIDAVEKLFSNDGAGR